MIKMVKIPGKLGKSSGTPLGPGEFEQEFYLTNSEEANVLRELAQEIEKDGRVEAVSSSWALGVNPMQPIKLEVQYEPINKELQIQVKLKETP